MTISAPVIVSAMANALHHAPTGPRDPIEATLWGQWLRPINDKSLPPDFSKSCAEIRFHVIILRRHQVSWRLANWRVSAVARATASLRASLPAIQAASG